MIILIATLLACHFVGDFSPLSSTWMLNAKSVGKPYFPILVHAFVHALLMGLTLVFFVSVKMVLTLAFVQLGTHFSIDVWKGKMNTWFPAVSNPHQKTYWLLFGLDQLLHQLVILTMVWLAFKT